MGPIVELADQSWRGPAIDLPRTEIPIEVSTLAQAVRTQADDRVRCQTPGPLHHYVGWIESSMSFSLPTALATAARSIGATSPYDEEIDAMRSKQEAIPTMEIDASGERRELAAATTEVERLREEVARLGGKVESRRELSAETTPATDALEDAVAELSEAETERVAAEQRLQEKLQRIEEERNRRNLRMRLGDRLSNLERDARRYLVEQHYDSFRRALDAVPGSATGGTGPDDYRGDDITAALAIVRMADLSGPVILDIDRFADARSARECLGANVIHIADN